MQHNEMGGGRDLVPADVEGQGVDAEAVEKFDKLVTAWREHGGELAPQADKALAVMNKIPGADKWLGSAKQWIMEKAEALPETAGAAAGTAATTTAGAHVGSILLRYGAIKGLGKAAGAAVYDAFLVLASKWIAEQWGKRIAETVDNLNPQAA